MMQPRDPLATAVPGDAPGYPRLLGDVGGTNARWAWQARPGDLPAQVRSFAASDHTTIAESIAAYLRQQRLPPPCDVAFGIATAVTGDAVRMTNHPWSFSISALKRSLGVERLLVLNDFEALAHAVPALGGDALQPIGRAASGATGAALALIGPGTGLGVSGLVADGRGGWRVVAGEGGHVTLAPADAREAALLALLRTRFGHVSAERACSGPGLVNLYQAVCARDGAAAEALDPAQVVERALQAGPGDASCVEALSVFASLLGNVAGNLALTLGARGGVFIGGGIVPRLGERFAELPFRERFEDKGRFRGYLEAIPTWVITAEAPALLGAARALDDMP
jgi:glucokinase